MSAKQWATTTNMIVMKNIDDFVDSLNGVLGYSNSFTLYNMHDLLLTRTSSTQTTLYCNSGDFSNNLDELVKNAPVPFESSGFSSKADGFSSKTNNVRCHIF